MAGEWRSSTIGDLCDEGGVELQTGPFGSQLHAHDYVEDGVPVVPTEAIRDRRIDHSVLPKISSSKAAELARHRLKVGDILFARRGVQATGHIGCVRATEEGFLCGTGAIRLRINEAQESLSSDFLSHILANPVAIDWFKFHAIGATMPNLNESIIRSFPVPMPPMTEQRAIAHILGTLDDKIELNRRMSETLEAMARALFKSWFADFDPVRAKAAGRDPGLPKPLADLFPTRLVDYDLGEIPEGWEMGTLSDVVELLREQVNPLTSPNAPFRHFSIPAFDERRWPKEELGAAIRSQKSRVVRGVVLLSRLNPEIERVWLVDIEVGDQAVCSTEFLVLRPRLPVGRGFLYCVVRTPLFRQHLQALVTGTSKSHQRAQADSLLALPAIRPSSVSVKEFERRAELFLTRSLKCLRETRTLAALRDALLPKLISGELRLNDRDSVIERSMP